MPLPAFSTLARCLVALAIIVASGCGKRESPAATGSETTPPPATPRLAVLSPAMAIILHDLGRADTIVGRHGWDMVCDAAIPIVGDQRGIDYEVLISVDPDAIVMEAGAEAVPARLSELASGRDWRIERLPMLSLADIRAAIVALDAMTAEDGETPSKAASALLDRMDRAMRPSDELRRRAGQTIILASADPIGVMGPGSFHDQIARALGLRVIPESGAAYIALPPEELHTLNPDTIVLIAPGATESERAAMLAPLAGLALDAVANNRVILITDRLALTPSTAMIDFAEVLAERISELPIVDQ